MLPYPPPSTYAVARLDVQATVQNLDSDAQDAARTIKPVQCLVYLYEVSPIIIARWLTPSGLMIHFRFWSIPVQTSHGRGSARGSSALDPERRTTITASLATCAFPSTRPPRTKAVVNQSVRNRCSHSRTATTGRTQTCCSVFQAVTSQPETPRRWSR